MKREFQGHESSAERIRKIARLAYEQAAEPTPEPEPTGRIAQRMSMLDDAARAAGVPPRLLDCRWEGCPEVVRHEMRAFSRKNYFLTGAVGTGKSAAAACLVRSRLAQRATQKTDRERQRVDRGYGEYPRIRPLDFVPKIGGVEWHDFRTLVGKVQETYSGGATQSFLNRLVALQLLVIDEVVPSLTTDKARIIEWLLAQRHAEEKQTVLTSNYTLPRLMKAIKKAAGDDDDWAMDRIESRIVSSFKNLHFKGADRRLK